MPTFPIVFRAGAARVRRRWLVAALLWFLVCLVTLAPASAAVRLLTWRLPQLELAAVEGSFWQGRAGQAFWRIGNQRIALGRLDWNLSGWSLLWLHPSAHVSAEWGEQIVSTDLRVSPLGTVTLRDTRAALPVELVKIWAPIPARGTLTLALDRAEFDRDGLRELKGNGEWRRAQWQWGARWLALGDYQFSVNTDRQFSANTDSNGAIAGSIKGAGDIGANGNFTFDARARRYGVQTKLTVSRGLPQEFRDSLIFLLGAKPQPDATPGAPLVLQLERSGTLQ